MSFDLDTQGAREIDERAAREGVPLGMPDVDPGFFSGTAQASLQGLARGTVGKGALLLGDAVTPALRPTAQAVDKLVGSSLDKWLDEQQRRTRQMLVDLRPDPLTTGWAGQVMGGLFDLGSSALLYTPEGAAVLEGYSRRTELMGEGVDQGTATAAGALSGVATLVGVKAPVTLGRAAVGQGVPTVARNAGYGAGIGVATGVAERGGTSDVLKRAGYPDQAALNEPYDRTTMAADAVLGALFSGSAAALEARFGTKAQTAVDAALAVRRASHAGLETAPGVPADAKAAAAHAQAFDTAMEQALRNEPVNVGEALADTTFVRSPAGQGRDLQGELQRHVADLLPAPAFQPPANAPRGIRSNNPGNLRATGERWQGQTGADGGFVTFDSPQAGVRALARTLMTYQDRHGLNTVEGIIGRWAPPRENNTPAYVLAVARAMGIEPTAELNVHDPATMRRLVEAIVRHENGQQPYPEALLRGGVDDALGGRAASPPARDLAPPQPGAAAAEASQRRSIEAGVPREGADTGGVPLDLRAELESKLGRYEAAALQSGGEAGRAMSDAGGAGQAAPMEFTTAKGSVYQVHDDGTTTRNKAARQDSGHEGDAGPKERTVRTVYVDADAAALSAAGLSNLGPRGARVVLADGKASLLTWNEGKGRWGAAASARDIPVHDQPAVGRHPLELWEHADDVPGRQAFSKMHAGNRITEIRRSPAAGGAGRAVQRGDARPAGSQQHGDAGSTPVGNTARAGVPAHAHDAATPARQAVEPALAAAAEVATLRPDMLVAMEDGTELPAAEVLARAEADRVQAEQDARAFEAAANCFLRS